MNTVIFTKHDNGPVLSRQGRLNTIDCHVAEFTRLGGLILSTAEGLLAMT
jgi:hypothetical protein